MVEPYYFEIPVYRCKIEKHTMEMKKRESEFDNHEIKETAPISYQNLKNHFHKTIWYPWRYNEVIGWVCLYILGNQIRADYYFITAKRIGKGIRKKRFQYFGKAFEHSLSRNLSSKEIFQEIINQLENLTKNEFPFKGRYIDISTFKTMGEFVDWKSLTKKLNSFNKTI